MGLLAPLYALAALAIAAPIIFHMIRRQPQGQIPFSSLMFLRTSPPRLTRRSRLDNLFLLLLRGLALLLIALAFSRPYWRQKDLVGQAGPARTVAILLDVSASMQRNEVWQAALNEARSVISDLSKQDQVALYTIDNQLKPIVSVEEINTAAKQNSNLIASHGLVEDQLSKISRTWNSSMLSTGLIGLADQLNASGLGAEATSAGNSQIVLISDFHTDSGLDELQGYAWPKQILVDLRIVGSDQPGNARASLMQSDEATVNPIAETKIRIENNSHSQQDSFSLQWSDSQGTAIGPVTSVQVTPGQVRVITLPAKPERAQNVQLLQDGWSGDNTVFVPKSQQVEQRIIFCGSSASKPEEDLSYFLSQAPLSTSTFRRQVVRVKADELVLLAGAEDVLAVVIEPTIELMSQADTLKKLAAGGVSVVIALTEQSGKLAGIEGFLASVLFPESTRADAIDLKLSESANEGHAMLAFVDYRSEVFSSLADPRFNDFSKIRIWKHRQLNWKETQSVEVLARLDDQSPWLSRARAGAGNVWLLSSGWQTSESSFALSSKFIPVMMRVLDPNPREQGFARVVEVGEQIDLQDTAPYSVTNQLGQSIDSQTANESNKFQFTEPGLYNIKGARWNQQLAVQVAANESRLTPQDSTVLKQLGVRTEKLESDTEIQDRLRQMKIDELENQQRMWKWILVAGLSVLLLETFCAGWAARRTEE
jgi:Aerotolerance regulator N-terminal